MLRDFLGAYFGRFLLLALVFLVNAVVLRRRTAQNRTQRENHFLFRHGFVADGYRAVFHSARCLHDRMIPFGKGHVSRRKIIDFAGLLESDTDNFIGYILRGGLFHAVSVHFVFHID